MQDRARANLDFATAIPYMATVEIDSKSQGE